MSWREEVAGLPSLAPVEFSLDTDRTALVIVDMQYVDAHRDHGLGESLRRTHPEVWAYYFARVEDYVVPNVKRILDAFRRAQMRVIYLTLGPVLEVRGAAVRRCLTEVLEGRWRRRSAHHRQQAGLREKNTNRAAHRRAALRGPRTP